MAIPQYEELIDPGTFISGKARPLKNHECVCSIWIASGEFHGKSMVRVVLFRFFCWLIPVRSLTRWWFQIFCMFIPIWGRFPTWLIFSDGLKPSTSKRIAFVRGVFSGSEELGILGNYTGKIGNPHPPWTSPLKNQWLPSPSFWAFTNYTPVARTWQWLKSLFSIGNTSSFQAHFPLPC